MDRRNRTPDRGMDCPTAHGGVRLGACSAVPDSRSRSRLWARSSSGAFGRSASETDRHRRARHGKTRMSNGLSARSVGNASTMSSCLANGIFAICCCRTRPTTTKRARTCPSIRMHRHGALSRRLAVFSACRSWAGFIINMAGCDLRQRQVIYRFTCATFTDASGERYVESIGGLEVVQWGVRLSVPGLRLRGRE